ncbi:hypothetical protein GLO73106DRAFT_00001140 [Gloeocapsa sp. PCC 73106]|nr:hypothetical protein GLO73106DRAFT_00001140 [Gloeocapsa sp. PCC 73106]
MSLAIATVATWVSINTKEEVFQASMALIALLSTLLTLFFAPLLLKVLIVAFAWLLEKTRYLSVRKIS